MLINVSVGELIDKFTILLIKQKKITNNEKLLKVKTEIEYLQPNIQKVKDNYDIDDLLEQLMEINSKLWDIEDTIRIKEKNKEFDNEFIQLARSVYFTNDKRAHIKNIINEKTESFIFEVKSYEKY
tara:strand:+ start:27 stop:404 length:378 start_codon:yes stop_codon:yes gene_type:complete